jgi:hypothetical protein
MLPPQRSPLFRYTLGSDLLGTRRLRYEPVGGDQLSLSLHRDHLKIHGTGLDYSAGLSFVKDGRAYVARAYQAAGIEADVTARVEQYDPNAFLWQPYYQGQINFEAAEFTATQAKVTIEQQSWLAKFLSRDSVQVDMFSGTSVGGSAGPVPSPVTIALHSRAVLQRYVGTQSTARTDGTIMYGDEDDPSHEQLYYFGFDKQEVNDFGLGAVAGGWVAGGTGDVVAIYTAGGSGDHTIELNLNLHVEAHNNGQGPEFETVEGDFYLKFKRGGALLQAHQLVPAYYQGNLGGDYIGDLITGPQSFTINLQQGDTVELYARYYIHDIGGAGTSIRYRSTLDGTLQPGSYFRMSAVTTTPPTDTQGLLLYEALERTCQALTDEIDVFRSDFFGRTDRGYAVDGPGALTLYTGGFQVRGFPSLNAAPPVGDALDLRKSLYATWRTLFDSLAAVYGLGWGLEWAINERGKLVQVIRVEPLAYFYPERVVLDLTGYGRLTVKTTVSAAAHYQVAEIGYRQWQAQTLGGLDEFNASRQWTTPLTRTENTYSQLSELSASGTLLEATRRDRFDATATTDTSRDAVGFLVCLLRWGPTGYETERNQLATVLTGVISPSTVYNLRLRPSRVLRRGHGAVLRAGLKALRGALVRSTTGPGNGGLTCQLTDEPAPTTENADVPVAELPAPLWRPEQDTFTAPVSRDELHQLLRQPTGRVRYLDERGQRREGWILDFKHAATEQTGDFTLLPCA